MKTKLRCPDFQARALSTLLPASGRPAPDAQEMPHRRRLLLFEVSFRQMWGCHPAVLGTVFFFRAYALPTGIEIKHS